MKLRRTHLQAELFTRSPSCAMSALPEEIRAEVVQLLETLLREVAGGRVRQLSGEEARDEQDQR